MQETMRQIKNMLTKKIIESKVFTPSQLLRTVKNGKI